MLLHNFTLVKGIGVKTQKALRRFDVFTWDDFLFRTRIPGFSDSRKKEINHELLNLKLKLEGGEEDFFVRVLPSNLHWMLFPFFEIANR